VNKLSTLSQRLLVVLLILPAGLFVIVSGGWVITLAAAAILARAGWEYWRMFRMGGYRPSLMLLAGGSAAFAVARHLTGFELTGLLLSLLMLANMALQVVNYRQNKDTAGLDFNINLGGVIYLGWLGSYLISLRDLPGGLVWFMLVLPATWLADGAAYLVGSRIGRHKMAPYISPKKSWEGYIGGVVLGTLGTVLLGAAWRSFNPLVSLEQALVIGLVISIFSPLGDLCESLLKRGFGLKDTSNLMPGHGGMLDRIDSWLWAAPLGYYLITILWM
jgi:phosphatidate cytidylyltransferase